MGCWLGKDVPPLKMQGTYRHTPLVSTHVLVLDDELCIAGVMAGLFMAVDNTPYSFAAR
jgi:hypothetical protein